MGGGSWENQLISESLMPGSALCADNRVNAILLKVQIDPSHKCQKSEIEMRSLAIMSLIQLGMVVGLNMS